MVQHTVLYLLTNTLYCAILKKYALVQFTSDHRRSVGRGARASKFYWLLLEGGGARPPNFGQDS